MKSFQFIFSLIALCTLLHSSAEAQELFNFDYETSFPAYGFTYAFAGEGLPDCSGGPDGGPFISSSFDVTTGPAASASLDTSAWMPAADACFDFVGWGLGNGHLLGFDDGAGGLTYNQMLTSSDLSEYTLQFDAWTTGTDPFLEMQFQLQFQGPSIDPGTGFPQTQLAVGIDASGVPPLLDNTPQTFTFTLDTLDIVGGSLTDWINAPFSETTQIQLQAQPQGNSTSVGLDNDNIFFIDNFSLTAPHDVIDNLTCDLDGSTTCDITDADLMVADIVDGTNLFDLTGDGMVNFDDMVEWLGQAGAENLASGNAYLVGDATLDGVVDGLDFIEWNDNKFTSVAAWSAGDFNADGVVDGLDFIAWNDNKFMSSGAAVPEPATAVLLLSMIGLLGLGRRR